MRVEVDLPNANNVLVPGMYVTVAFRLQPKGLVEVPAAALIFRAGGPRVARVDSDGRVDFVERHHRPRQRQLGGAESGVKPGDRLVLNISSQIAAGQIVSAHAAPADKALTGMR